MQNELSTITIADHGPTSSGPEAMRVVQLATLAAGLRLEIRAPGLKLSRHGSALKFAKQFTGLRTNDRTKQLEAVNTLLETARSRVAYVDTRTA